MYNDMDNKDMDKIIHQSNITASTMAIEYLQEQNCYDLRELGQERWQQLIEIITENYELTKIKLEKDLDDIPF